MNQAGFCAWVARGMNPPVLVTNRATGLPVAAGENPEAVIIHCDAERAQWIVDHAADDRLVEIARTIVRSGHRVSIRGGRRWTKNERLIGGLKFEPECGRNFIRIQGLWAIVTAIEALATVDTNPVAFLSDGGAVRSRLEVRG